jgi:hypothetical protein
MRMAKNPSPKTVSVPERYESALLWLIRGKWSGKICRLGRFVPGRPVRAVIAPIQKLQQCQSLESADTLGTAFA